MCVCDNQLEQLEALTCSDDTWAGSREKGAAHTENGAYLSKPTHVQSQQEFERVSDRPHLLSLDGGFIALNYNHRLTLSVEVLFRMCLLGSTLVEG